MSKRQCWSVWLISSVAFLLVDIRSVALPQKGASPRRCHTCGPSAHQRADCATELCPDERPYCGTAASAPNLTSSLVCTEPTEKVCSLTYIESKETYYFICVCNTDLCNVAFKPQVYQELKVFASTHPAAVTNRTDFSEVYYRWLQFGNLTKPISYSALTVNKEVVTSTTARGTTLGHSTETHHMPKAEPLKQEGPAPSDDDDEEGEGSGALEETRVQARPAPASAPAAPSSYLPAHDNKATPIIVNAFLSLTLFLYHVII